MTKCYEEKRTVCRYELQSLAITRQWFTHANNSQYDKWLAYGDKDNLTLDDLIEMAEMVIEYSEPQSDTCTHEQIVSDVMFIIELKCIHTFNIVY